MITTQIRETSDQKTSGELRCLSSASCKSKFEEMDTLLVRKSVTCLDSGWNLQFWRSLNRKERMLLAGTLIFFHRLVESETCSSCPVFFDATQIGIELKDNLARDALLMGVTFESGGSALAGFVMEYLLDKIIPRDRRLKRFCKKSKTLSLSGNLPWYREEVWQSISRSCHCGHAAK